MHFHEHCQSCISRFCQFEVVKDVSCVMVFCENDCRSRFHLCKQHDHNETCQFQVIDCINKQYGCPKKLKRGQLGRHLEICPANVLICTVEWNRWHHGSLLSKFDWKCEVQRIKDQKIVDKNLEIACSIHDQSILLQSAMPSPVLKYYSDLANDKNKDVSSVEPIQEDAVLSLYRDESASVKKRSIETSKLESQSVKMSSLSKPYVQNFKSDGTVLMSPVNTLDSDAHIAISVVDDILDQVVTLVDDRPFGVTKITAIDWKEDEIPKYSDIKSKYLDLQHSISELFQGMGVTQSQSQGNSRRENERETRREKRKKRNWPFKSNIKSEGRMSASWGWMTRKQVKDASTDTIDLSVDKRSLEWLSPEAHVSQEDLIFRLFSIIGAASRLGSAFKEKQVDHFTVEASCQTLAPFLLHLDLNSIGRAMLSATLPSATTNLENSLQTDPMLNYMSKTQTDCNLPPVEMSKELKYNNLGLGNVLESVPRYQTKPVSMYSFMCGCLMRRDQFSSHIQNIHCEIMSGLNGWVEEKCPHAAYGCMYSQPRLCPDHRSNAVVYDQSEGAFTVLPRHWDRHKSVSPGLHSAHLSFVNLPYEVHERILSFLDCYSLRQLSLTCSYLREFCKSHLVTRGIVETRWSKRVYCDGTTSWKMNERIWSFPRTTTKIGRWVPSDRPPMAYHVFKCHTIEKCGTERGGERVRVLPT